MPDQTLLDDIQGLINSEIAMLEAQAAILRVLQPFDKERQAHIIEAAWHIVEAQRMVPGLQVRFPNA